MTRLQKTLLTGSFVVAGILPVELNARSVACPENIGEAAQRAERILDRSQDTQISEHDRAALVCLARAVGLVDERLQGLSDGSLPFDGQIHIPKGYIMNKPPTSEGR